MKLERTSQHAEPTAASAAWAVARLVMVALALHLSASLATAARAEGIALVPVTTCERPSEANRSAQPAACANLPEEDAIDALAAQGDHAGVQPVVLRVLSRSGLLGTPPPASH